MIKVLVTGVGGGVGQGIIKSLKLIKDLNVEIIAADMSELASGLYSGSYAYLVPSANDEQYFNKISDICIDNNIDYYFPGTDVELLLCAKNKERLMSQADSKIIISPQSVIEIADNKLKTVEFLEREGFAYPLTWLPEEVELGELNYPLIVKPQVGCRSIGVHLVRDKEEAFDAIKSLQNPIIQEYLNGDEYTCTVAVRSGVVSDVLCLKRDLRSGDTFRATPVKNLIIERYVRDIALRLEVDGSCNFQLRLVDGVPKLFEINSRFSGTTPFCSYLGFNPVEFCLKTDLGIGYKSNIDYGKIILRHWSEVVISQSEIDELSERGEGKINAAGISGML